MKKADPKKKKRKDPIYKPAANPKQIVEMCNYFNLCLAIRTLSLVNGYTYEQLFEFGQSYAVLLEEVSDGRTTVQQFIKDTKEMTGIDVRVFLNDVCKSFEV